MLMNLMIENTIYHTADVGRADADSEWH